MPNKFFPPQTDTATRLAATPMAGELIFDTEENALYTGDGVTPGGLPTGGTGDGGGGVGTGIIEGRLTFPHTTTPPDPGAGNTAIYAKDDGKIYQLAAGGVEEEIGTGGATFKAATIQDVTDTVTLTLESDYYQFLTPTVASVIVKLPAVIEGDYFECEIVNISIVNALAIQENDGTAIITLENTGDKARSIYAFWDGATWQVWIRGYY